MPQYFFQKPGREGKYIISICPLLRLYGILSRLLPELNSWFNHLRVYLTFPFLFQFAQKVQGGGVYISELLLYAR